MTTPIKTLLDLAETRQISDDLLKQAVVEGRKKGILPKHHIESLPKNKVGDFLKKLYDETPLDMLDPGKGKTHQAYMWVLVGGKSSNPGYQGTGN